MEHVERRKPRKRSKPSVIAVERRRDLQDAAIRCIADKGYAAVTVAMICDDAGFSRGLIGHYFKGKDELVLEAISRSTTQLAEATRRLVDAAGSDPADRLHAVVRSSFSPPGFTPNQAAVWISLASNARWIPALGEMYRQLWQDFCAGIAGLFQRAAAQYKLAVDAKGAALMISRMIEGFWIGWVANPDMMTVAEAEHACHTLVDLMLGESSRRTRRLAQERKSPAGT
jgi:TetR/AcrR family transcriptional repressor of bet genes